MMDVTGNNIANVNTTAFKGSRVTFQDIISQTMRQSSGPTTAIAGLNTMQVGLGMQTATIDTLFQQGNLQSTGKPTDLGYQGDGFFVLSDNAATPTYFYTRDGNFDLGVNTTGGPRPLVHTASGMHVKGYLGLFAGPADATAAPTQDIEIPQSMTSTISPPATSPVTAFTVSSSGIISLALADGSTIANYATIASAAFQNPAGMIRVGGNMFQPSANSGAPGFNQADTNGRGKLTQSILEMSNVDLAKEFTSMIISQRGFQANSRVITTSDEILGDLVNIKR
jgi:flagellar hook protein FlgE